jgi:hypothetical protein
MSSQKHPNAKSVKQIVRKRNIECMTIKRVGKRTLDRVSIKKQKDKKQQKSSESGQDCAGSKERRKTVGKGSNVQYTQWLGRNRTEVKG